MSFLDPTPHRRAIGGLFVLALLAAGAAHAQFAPYGLDTGPGVIVTISGGPADGCSPSDDCPTSMTITGQPPYDGNIGGHDVYVGVVNNATVPVTFLDARGTGLFDFIPNHGIDVYAMVSNGQDPTGYGGPNAYFIVPTPPAPAEIGLVKFIDPIQPRGTAYFSLSDMPVSFNNGVPEPAAWSLMLAGVALAGGALRRRSQILRSCQ